MRQVGMFFAACCYGIASAAGVFTALTATGLIPRFTAKTHTAKYTMWYENVVVLGVGAGVCCSIYTGCYQINLGVTVATIMQLVYGVFSGMYVGCLALAIAEMLDSIPVLTRRIQLKKGMGIAVLGIAFGKLTGSLIYFEFLKNLF